MIAPGERASPSATTTDGHDVPRGGSSPCAVDSPSAVGQQLLAEFIRYGRQRPFEEIVRRYAGMVFNTCFRVTKDKHDAEDATQAVFLTLAVQAKRGAEIKALGPWLQQVAKRLSLDVKRGQKRRKTREEKHQDEQSRRRTAIDEDALPSPDLEELKLILHEELQKLPAKYRLPLILHYFGGMTRDEMAAELNCKPSTLGVRIFRGREMLAGRLNGRGIHLSAGAMALAIGYLVKQTVTGAVIARTSHAAAALASGSADLTTVGQLMASHAGTAEAAARVVGLTRRASHVLVIGKVRVSVSIALLAGTSLGAGVKAFTLLPQMSMGEVRQMISNGVTRLVQPFVEPLTRPLHIRAEAPTAEPNLLPAPVATRSAASGPLLLPPAATPAGTAIAGGVGIIALKGGDATASVGSLGRADAAGEAVAAAAAPSAPEHANAPAAPAVAGDVAAPGGTARRSGDASSVRAATPPALLASLGDTASATPETMLTGGGGMTASAANDLYVPADAGSSVYTLGGTYGQATSSQILQVPAVGGSVSASDGVVRGYGKISRTGTLSVSGKVVADGDGVDRTLDLTSFSAVSVASTGSATTPGWYAADHGRLSLSLEGPTKATAGGAAKSAAVGPTASSSSAVMGTTLAAIAPPPATTATVLTWGADPSEAVLTPVNSVRMTIHGGPVPTALSLLAPDRSDAPVVPSADGAPIGLWEVDPVGTPLSAVDLLIRYDDHLAGLLGADESDVKLWTLGDPLAGWQAVTDASFTLDLADHIVGGSATDVSYFAVTVPPAGGIDADPIIAHPALMMAPRMAASASVVPEPSAIATTALAAMGLLGRRRRKSGGSCNPPRTAASEQVTWDPAARRSGV